MIRNHRVATGAVMAAFVALAFSVPAGASGFTIDSIMKNDLKVKTAPSSQLTVGGSSFDAPLVLSAQTQWNTDTSKSPFATYSTTKSGTGRANVISGAYQIGCSDFPLNIAAPDVGPGSSNPSDSVGNYVQVPMALGGVAIIYHFGSGVSGTGATLINKNGVIMSGAVLGQIFAGKIKKWNDPKIANLNPKLKSAGKTVLPNISINVESRTSGSGTTFVFQDYLSRVDHGDFPAATSNAFAAAVAQSANSGALDTAVHSTAGAIGYVEFGYAIANGNPTVKLVNASHATVALSSKGVLAAATAGLKTIAKHGGFKTSAIANFSINNALGATVYPIAGFSYCIVKKNQGNLTNAISTVKFLDFLVHQGGGTTKANTFGQDLANDAGFVAMPLSLQKISRGLLLGVKSGGNVVLKATN
jgi:phosphate transport system substrate-binding protein